MLISLTCLSLFHCSPMQQKIPKKNVRGEHYKREITENKLIFLRKISEVVSCCRNYGMSEECLHLCVGENTFECSMLCKYMFEHIAKTCIHGKAH